MPPHARARVRTHRRRAVRLRAQPRPRELGPRLRRVLALELRPALKVGWHGRRLLLLDQGRRRGHRRRRLAASIRIGVPSLTLSPTLTSTSATVPPPATGRPSSPCPTPA